MPRYYFDTRDGGRLIVDDEDSELAGLEAAQQEATEALAMLVRDRLPQTERYDMALEVRDEAKRPLLRAQLSFDVQRVHEP